MKLETVLYAEYEENLPQEGKYILSQLRAESIIVYQAFNPSIANYAVENQKFGGSTYSFNRMSWIKPNFLWMMYRSGWASKEGQERILAIEISKINFEKILRQAVHSSYNEDVYKTKEVWKDKLQKSNVRLQWDPDHNPHGEKLSRRAIQLGLRSNVLREFVDDWIISIQDITPFVVDAKIKLDDKNYEQFRVVKEEVIEITDEEIRLNLGLD